MLSTCNWLEASQLGDTYLKVALNQCRSSTRSASRIASRPLSPVCISACRLKLRSHTKTYTHRHGEGDRRYERLLIQVSRNLELHHFERKDNPDYAIVYASTPGGRGLPSHTVLFGGGADNQLSQTTLHVLERCLMTGWPDKYKQQDLTMSKNAPCHCPKQLWGNSSALSKAGLCSRRPYLEEGHGRLLLQLIQRDQRTCLLLPGGILILAGWESMSKGPSYHSQTNDAFIVSKQSPNELPYNCQHCGNTQSVKYHPHQYGAFIIHCAIECTTIRQRPRSKAATHASTLDLEASLAKAYDP